jgi:hypothetical protein
MIWQLIMAGAWGLVGSHLGADTTAKATAILIQMAIQIVISRAWGVPRIPKGSSLVSRGSAYSHSSNVLFGSIN